MSVQIVRGGSERRAAPGPEGQFTGSVWMKRVADGADLRAACVTFAPGGRTRWHRHTGDQVLYVLAGTGLVGTRGGAPRRIGPGDAVHVAAGEEHWHGAGPDDPMVHLAVTAGENVWLEAVAEPEYLQAAGE